MKSPNRGHEIAKQLWPELCFTPEGGYWDKYGIDALMGDETVQIKYDRRIPFSRNLYHEVYEKSANIPSQLWRQSSPGKVSYFIFTTETNLSISGYLVSIDSLAQAEQGKVLTTISPNNGASTSMGYLIPVSVIKAELRQQLKQVYSQNRKS